MYLREAGKLKLNDLVVRAQNYCEAHNIRAGYGENGHRPPVNRNKMGVNNSFTPKGYANDKGQGRTSNDVGNNGVI